MPYLKETIGTVEAASRRLISAAAARGMRVVGQHTMKWNPELSEGLAGWECRVYEFCDVVNFRRALESNLSAVLALPCRVAVYGRPGALTIATVKMTALLRAAGVLRNIHASAHAIERAILDAIDDACSKAPESDRRFADRNSQRLAAAAN